MAEMDLPDIDLEGRVVIMTDADRGLGRAMSLGLAKRCAPGVKKKVRVPLFLTPIADADGHQDQSKKTRWP